MEEFQLDTCIILWQYELDKRFDDSLQMDLIRSTISHLVELKKIVDEKL